jgi:hypothetical protein
MGTVLLLSSKYTGTDRLQGTRIEQAWTSIATPEYCTRKSTYYFLRRHFKTLKQFVPNLVTY